MPRVTKAALQAEVKQLRREKEVLVEDGSAWVDRAIRAEIAKDRIEDLYTRVRVAIGGGTGQEPWDIFAKIGDLKADGAYWLSRTQYWSGECSKADRRVWALENPTPWHERARAKVKAWWNRNHTAVLMYFVAAWIAGLWFVIGRASAQ